MKAVIITKQGTPVTPNVQYTEDYPKPIPGSSEVLVKTEASALNHLDLWVGRGVPGINPDFPHVSGSDGAGIIEAVGEGVDQSWIGKRVALNAAKPIAEPLPPDCVPVKPDYSVIGEHEKGTNAEYFIAPLANIMDIGDADPVKAAAFSLAHLTAWRMLKVRANIQPGHVILITGIGGGVALAALNIAKHFGCKIIVTSRHQWKLDKAIELGAHHGVLDTGDDWSRDVRNFTGRRGVDICVDSIGKATHLFAIKSLARGGTYATCGCTTGADATTDLARIFWNQLSIVGSTMGDMKDFREILSLFLAGAIEPVIDNIFDAAEGNSAFERLESGEQFGKIVIRWQ